MIQNLTGKSNIYTAVFLDLDGTITESGIGCINGIKYMFEKIGFAQYSKEELSTFIGPPIIHHLMELYGFNEKDATKAYEFFKEYYHNQGIYESRLYDGIREAIIDIKDSGKKIYLATSKPEAQALCVLEHYNLLSLFSDVFAARHDLGVYNKSQVLERAVSLIGGIPRSIMVGDRHYDILGGKHVGFDTAGVLYGYGDIKELTAAGCDYIVDTAQDLSKLLGRNNI
ncbi:MAG: HAD hydrolase-like protein [Christensenellales bacterium]